MAALKKFSFNTVSKDILDEKISGEPARIRIFNFQNGVRIFDLDESKIRSMIGAYDTSWVRVYDEDEKYYDFVTSSVFFIANKAGVLLLVDEDCEMINIEYISRTIIDYMQNDEVQLLTSQKYINSYYSKITREVKKVSKEIRYLYTASTSAASSRSDMEDSYELGRAQLTKKYLIDLISRKVIKENKEKIMELID